MSTTILIIIVTSAVSLYAWKRSDLYERWMMNPHMISTRNEYFRFITSGFIHSNYMHLIFNMIALYFFGSNVELIFNYLFGGYSVLIFLLFYVGGIVVSDIPTFLKNRQNRNYNSLGASGGVAAILFSSILYDPVSIIYVYFIPIPGFILGALYIVYSYQQGKRMRDNINHDAHLWGALFGLAFTVILDPGVIITFFEQLLSYRIF